ncbi:MAG: alanine racemase [Pseudomonadota bacterium]
MSFGARALIRLGALTHNLQVISKTATRARIMAVIKANAYGHGMLTVARHLPDVDAFAVARLPEAIELRQQGIRRPIVLLSGTLTPDELATALMYDCEPVVHEASQVSLLEKATSGTTRVWLKVDTGMHRLGFSLTEAAAILDRLRRCAAVQDIVLMTHLASADQVDGESVTRQLEQFRTLATDYDGDISIANSPALLGHPSLADAANTLGISGQHWVRTGIALFGISPFADKTAKDFDLQPVMQFEARLVAIKALEAGGAVGYTGNYVAPQDTILGIVSAGYGDGYSRHFKTGTPVLINGRRVPLIGRVSMDMIAVDLGNDGRDQVGDVATLWGAELPIELVAPYADAIPYDLVCGIMNREEQEVIA